MPYTTRRTVVFGDCDPAGAVYTPRIAHFVVEAVLQFQSAVLERPAARWMFDLEILPPARSLAIEFLAPLTWDDELEVEVTCTRVGDTSFTTQAVGKRKDKVVAFRAVLTQVCVSAKTRDPVSVPAALRMALLSGH